jgi:hypothetical protein
MSLVAANGESIIVAGLEIPSRDPMSLATAGVQDCGNRFRALRRQRGLHPCQEAPTSRYDELTIDLHVELTHLPAGDFHVGIEPSSKFVGDGQGAVAIA